MLERIENECVQVVQGIIEEQSKSAIEQKEQKLHQLRRRLYMLKEEKQDIEFEIEATRNMDPQVLLKEYHEHECVTQLLMDEFNSLIEDVRVENAKNKRQKNEFLKDSPIIRRMLLKNEMDTEM